MNIEYQEHTLKEVADFFAKSFTPPKGTRIYNYEFMVTTDNRVIFKLFIEGVKEKNKVKAEPSVVLDT